MLNNYTWHGANRTDLDPRAARGSGGTGFLVKNNILDRYTVHELGSSYDGIYWIKLSDKVDDSSNVILCSCYLPPERSSRGNVSQEFYDALLADMYLMMGDNSPILLCGDFNARIGDKTDFIPTLEDIKHRKPLDTCSNSHGDCLVEFLKDSCCCVLNGRFDPANDNFTCVSHRGRSVVDYIIGSYSTFVNITDFRVYSMTEVIDKLGITDTISDRSKPSDHSMLVCALDMSPYSTIRHTPDYIQAPSNNIRKYNVNTIPEHFLTQPTVKTAIRTVIQRLEYATIRQADIDGIYSDFVNILHTEMDKSLKYRDTRTSRTVANKHRRRPYWNDNLSMLWNEARTAEKCYLSCKSNIQKSHLLRMYKDKRHIFDRALRKQERQYYNMSRNQIDTEPHSLWNYMKKLGPDRHTNVYDTVLLDDGTETSDPGKIREKWKHDFELLFNGISNSGDFDDEFLQRADTLYAQWSQELSDTGDEHNDQEDNTEAGTWNHLLNSRLDIEETIGALHRAKRDKIGTISILLLQSFTSNLSRLQMMELDLKCTRGQGYYSLSPPKLL